MDDVVKGEIYLVRNKINGKQYVGQTLKYVSVNKTKRGTEGRWRVHVHDAMNGMDEIRLLHEAIREFGPDNFEVTKICDCHESQLSILEDKYMREYNTFEPNGYNIICTTPVVKQCIMTEETKRKLEEPLPQHIYHIVIEHKLAGYFVDGLVDSNNCSIPRKYFYQNKNNWNLDHAKKYIENVQYILQNNIQVSDWNNIDDNVRRTKTGVESQYLPKNIQYVLDRQKTPIGYKVDSLRIPDGQGGTKRYNKWFGSKKYTMEQKYEMAIKHLEEITQKYTK
jgi:hypothetical protein